MGKKYKLLLEYTPRIDGIFSKFITNPLSVYCLLLIKNKRFSPNLITIASFVTAVFAGLLFLIPNHYIWVIAGLIVQLSFVLDGLDGTYARYTRQCSYFGAWLDRLFDRIADTLIVVVMCLSWSYNFHDNTIIKILPVLLFTNLIFWTGYDTMTIMGMFTQPADTDTLWIRLENFFLYKNIRFAFSRDVYLMFVSLGSFFFNPYFTLWGIIIGKNLNSFFKFKNFIKANK